MAIFTIVIAKKKKIKSLAAQLKKKRKIRLINNYGKKIMERKTY